MKTRIAIATASLFVASMGTTAYAQGTQSMPQQQTPPPASMQSTMSGQSVSSARVVQQVKRQLTTRGIATDGIMVAFQNGTVTLSGTVASQQVVTNAKAAAMHVPGVKHVDTTNLLVQPQGGQGQGAG